MGMASLPISPAPDLAIAGEVIRLADAAAAERHGQPVVAPIETGGKFEPPFRPSPARDELVAHLRQLQERDDGLTVARLYGLYRAGDLACTTREEAIERYLASSELAMMPMHRPYGAGDLASKAPLADGLRRGLAHLGLSTTDTLPINQEDPAMQRTMEHPEVATAATAVQDLVDRLMGLALDPDTGRARAAADVLATFGTRVVDAIMAAFPRAETPEQRAELLHVLDCVAPRWYIGITRFLGRVARDDPDRKVRIQANDLRRYLITIEGDLDDEDDDLDEEDW